MNVSLQVTYHLGNVNATLESLGPKGGFRRFMSEKAVELGLCGTIHRSKKRNVHLVVEGSLAQIQKLESVLEQLYEQRMIEVWTLEERDIRTTTMDGFRILPDTGPRKSDRCIDGIETGPYSECE